MLYKKIQKQFQRNIESRTLEFTIYYPWLDKSRFLKVSRPVFRQPLRANLDLLVNSITLNLSKIICFHHQNLQFFYLAATSKLNQLKLY